MYSKYNCKLVEQEDGVSSMYIQQIGVYADHYFGNKHFYQ